MIDAEILHFHLFCGLGGSALGMNRGDARAGQLRGIFRCIGGVDSSAPAVRDFTNLARCHGTVLDLFSRQQYLAFHGRQPPDGWREATPDDLRQAAGGERPNIIFSSPPCKGFSGLLSEARSSGHRYQALNELTIRGIWLALTAWEGDPAEFFVLENVPRIATRGRPLLDQIKALLRAHGYSVAETVHDCGEIGGLGQRRKRFLLVARHRERVPPYLYEPPRRPLLGVGDVIGGFPLPEHPAAGPMHRLPRLQWRTWVRLALVEAGSDWRSLERLRVENGHLADYLILPEAEYHSGIYGVAPWDAPAGTVTGHAKPSTGEFSVADPRIEQAFNAGHGVTPWGEAAGTVTSEAYPSTGSFAVADPRIAGGDGERAWQDGRRGLGVIPFDQPAGVVTAQGRAGQGAFAVADPRTGFTGDYGQYGVQDWDKPTGTIKGDPHPGTGRYSVADPRLAWNPNAYRNKFRVIAWREPSGTVIGCDQRPAVGAASVADPRLGCDAGDTQRRRYNNLFRVIGWPDPAQAVTGGCGPSAGAQAIADPRPQLGDNWHGGGPFGVARFDQPSATLTGAACHDNGAFSVADPRMPGIGEHLAAVIVALDGTWHRPFSTLELAALQGLVTPEEHFALDGSSHSGWRERIGNAVPPPAAAAIASVMGRALLLAWSGDTFALGSTPVWARGLAVAVSVDAP